MIERKRFLTDNLQTLLKIWLLSFGFWFCGLAVITSRDGGMMVLGLMLALTFFCGTCRQLNRLAADQDGRFMACAIFWTGSVILNLAGIAMRQYIGNISVLIASSMFNAMLISAVIYWLISTGYATERKSQRVSD
jgi:hypothetical protein